jgi:hypothetical protein
MLYALAVLKAGVAQLVPNLTPNMTVSRACLVFFCRIGIEFASFWHLAKYKALKSLQLRLV